MPQYKIIALIDTGDEMTTTFDGPFNSLDGAVAELNKFSANGQGSDGVLSQARIEQVEDGLND